MAVYITVKGGYLNDATKHWRLSAILRVVECCSSHAEAADWYKRRHIPLPSNCMVRGNRPLPASMTTYDNGTCNAVAKEDRTYQERAREHGSFLVCEALYRELVRPELISEKIMMKAFGRIPGTRTPPRITSQGLRSLVEQLGIANHVKHLDLICPE